MCNAVLIVTNPKATLPFIVNLEMSFCIAVNHVSSSCLWTLAVFNTFLILLFYDFFNLYSLFFLSMMIGCGITWMLWKLGRRRNRNLANVTVFTLLLGVFEGGQASSINSGHFEIGDEIEDPKRWKKWITHYSPHCPFSRIK